MVTIQDICGNAPRRIANRDVYGSRPTTQIAYNVIPRNQKLTASRTFMISLQLPLSRSSGT